MTQPDQQQDLDQRRDQILDDLQALWGEKTSYGSNLNEREQDLTDELAEVCSQLGEDPAETLEARRNAASSASPRRKLSGQS